MIESVEIGMLLSSSMLDKESGRAFIEILGPSFKPEKYNDHEPIKHVFSEDRIERVLELWNSGFFWRRSKPRVMGRYWAGTWAQPHDVVFLSLSLRGYNIEEVLSLLEGMDRRFGIDFGYIHARTDQDDEDLQYYRKYSMPFSQGVMTQALKEGIPDLPWGTVFGKPYRELFGDRLVDAPVHEIRELSGATYLQLTEDVRDVDRRREEIEAVRTAAKQHLDPTVFRPKPGEDWRCRLPVFSV